MAYGIFVLLMELEKSIASIFAYGFSHATIFSLTMLDA